MNDDESDRRVFDKLRHMIVNDNNEEIKNIIGGLYELDKSASIYYTIYLLRYLLVHDKYDQFEYWVNTMDFNIDLSSDYDQEKTLLMKIIEDHSGDIAIDAMINRINIVLKYTKYIDHMDRSDETTLYKLIKLI